MSDLQQQIYFLQLQSVGYSNNVCSLASDPMTKISLRLVYLLNRRHTQGNTIKTTAVEAISQDYKIA